MDTIAELNEERFVDNRGIVELRHFQGSEIHGKQDLFDFQAAHRISEDFTKKNRDTGEQATFWCLVCAVHLKCKGALVSHLRGKNHQSKIMGLTSKEEDPTTEEKKDDEEVNPVNLKCKLEGSECPAFPALGLNFITEYVKPADPKSELFYGCSLKRCRSFSGNAEDMSVHLTGPKQEHNRRFIHRQVPEALKLMNEITDEQIMEYFKSEQNGQVRLHEIKRVRDKKLYYKARHLAYKRIKREKGIEKEKTRVGKRRSDEAFERPADRDSYEFENERDFTFTFSLQKELLRAESQVEDINANLLGKLSISDSELS